MSYSMYFDPTTISVVVKTCTSILADVRLNLSPNGMDLLAMDGSHILLCQLHYDKADLSRFTCDIEQTITVNLEDWNNVLGRANGEEIALKSTEEMYCKTKIFRIEFEEPKSSQKRQFDLQQIDVDPSEINLESLDAMKYEHTHSLMIKHVNTIIQDAELFSEVLNITAKNLRIFFQSEGSHGKYLQTHLDSSQKENWTNTETAGFAIQFLKAIFNKTLCEHWSTTVVKLEVKEDQPLRITIPFGTKSFLKFWLAPRVEEE